MSEDDEQELREAMARAFGIRPEDVDLTGVSVYWEGGVRISARALDLHLDKAAKATSLAACHVPSTSSQIAPDRSRSRKKTAP